VITDTANVFTSIYRSNGFFGSESKSGPGSSLNKTEKLREELPELLFSLSIRRLVDAPCGDMNWMSHLNYNFDCFIGVDIVEDVIIEMRNKFTSNLFYFQIGDICNDVLPKADAIFCRDCLNHLSYQEIFKAISLFKKSESLFLFTTTFPDALLPSDRENRDIGTGGWRILNFQAEPFNWPTPVRLIREDRSDESAPWDKFKSLGVWTLQSLPTS